MASFPREHNTLYFDALIRTQKKESVLAFIMATYYAKKNNDDDTSVKDDIYKRLEYAYGLFRDNVRGYDNGVGSYGGTDSQFSSQYTLGLELGIWKNSKLDLNDLALKVATNEITITDYFDSVLLNYIQPVNGKIVHPLYQILKYIKNNSTDSIQKNEFANALGLSTEEAPGEAINALYNILLGTSYFIEGNNVLTVSNQYTVDTLLSRCNTKYLGNDGYEKAKNELENDDEKYIEYLISHNDHELSEEELASEIESEDLSEDRKFKFKQWLRNSNRFSENSVKNYSYYITYIKKHEFTDYDLYKINDTAIIDDLLIKFNSVDKYKSWNIKNRYTPSNALSTYKEFLLEELGNGNRDDARSIITGGYNMIYYGTPGCGKSHTVNEDFSQLNGFNSELVHRVTFHPEYSNSDFVGQILPKTDENNQVIYEFQAGPFSIALCDALKNQDKKVCLIIEEINRGNASAIFGDIFQLLDRDESGNSIYKIDNEPIKKYLRDNNVDIDKIYIPSNLWIIATMNTSDQNVFTLDTAFKRRWRMKRIPNKFNMDKDYDKKLSKMYIPGSSYTWEQFIESINKAILKNNPTGLNSEDKQLGVYFVTENELSFEPLNQDKESIEKFIEKVLMYIWDDVAKIDPSLWFGENINSFDELVSEYYEANLMVFKELFNDQQVTESQEIHEENN